MRINLPSSNMSMTHHPPKDVRRSLGVVLFRVSRPPLHDEGVQRAELEQMKNDQDDGAHCDENRQEPDEVAGCE